MAKSQQLREKIEIREALQACEEVTNIVLGNLTVQFAATGFTWSVELIWCHTTDSSNGIRLRQQSSKGSWFEVGCYDNMNELFADIFSTLNWN